MIKIKLLKDLPFIKSGTTGIFVDDSSLYMFQSKNKKDKAYYYLHEIEKLPDWFEIKNTGE